MSKIPQLTEKQWEEEFDRLTVHALRKFRKYKWCRGRKDEVEWAAPGGYSPADIAMKAITKALSAERGYNADKYKDFHSYMRSIVDSLMSHLVEEAVSHKTDRMPVIKSEETGELVEFEPEAKDCDPGQIAVSKETVNLIKTIAMAEAPKDPVIKPLVECAEEGISVPRDIAEYTGIDVKQIYVTKKRLGRKLDQAFASEKERQR